MPSRRPLLFALPALVLGFLPAVADAQRDGEVLPEEGLEMPPDDDPPGPGDVDAPPPPKRVIGKKKQRDAADPYSDDVDGEDTSLAGGFEVGLRTGFGIPSGRFERTAGTQRSDFGEGLHGKIPLWLDLGWRVNPRWFFGAYGIYGFVFPKEAEGAGSAGCPAGADCSASSLRLGLQAQFHASPSSGADPWFGLGFGWERYQAEVGAAGATTQVTATGFEWLNAQLGLDFPSDEGRSAFGIFVSYSVGQFGDTELETPAGTTKDSISQQASHHWLVLGIRGIADF